MVLIPKTKVMAVAAREIINKIVKTLRKARTPFL